MPEEIDYEKSSGNVFKDLGFDNADEIYAKSNIAIAIKQTIKARKLTQEQAAELLGTHRTHLSRLNSGSGIDSMSLDLLINWVVKLGGNVTIKIKSPPLIYKQCGKMKIATV